MKQKIITKIFVALLAFVMLFSLGTQSASTATTDKVITPKQEALINAISASADNVNASRSATRVQKKTQKKHTYTQTVADVEAQLKVLESKLDQVNTNTKKSELTKMQAHLKDADSYTDLARTITANFIGIIKDPVNADYLEIGIETVKSIVNLFASCYGLGDASNVIFDELINWGENPQSDIQKLQAQIDDQFVEVHNHLDSIQMDIADLSTKLEDCTNDTMDALEDAFEENYAREKVVNFMSGSMGNFNYVQFKNYLYGQTSGEENPHYYTQAYYNKLIESIVNGAPEDTITANYNALYRSLASTGQRGDAAITIFYDYLMYNAASGEESILHYYYDYLLANEEFLGDRSAEFEALIFASELYNAALFADYCISLCHNYQLLQIYEIYGANPSLYAEYIYGSGDNDKITYGEILESISAIEKRQADLEIQIAADVAYFFNLEGSFTIQDEQSNIRIITNTDEDTFGFVQPGQTIFLNMLTEKWCEIFGLDTAAFTYEWFLDGEWTENDGYHLVSNSHTTFQGRVKYKDEEIYSVSFCLAGGSAFNGGDGSAEDPYAINNAEQFTLIASTKDGMNKHYVLTDDLDFTNVPFSPIGTEERPFNGFIEGNGYTIRNMTVSSGDNVGIFCYVSEYGIIQNLNVEYSSFTATNTGAVNLYAGAIAAINEGTIHNCRVNKTTVSISETSSLLNKHISAYAAGIVGQNTGTIEYCAVDDTQVNASLIRDYASESASSNRIYAYSAGIAANLAGSGTVKHCSVTAATGIGAEAYVTCYNNWSVQRPYITMRAGGIAAKVSDITCIDDVWSDATNTKLYYSTDNTAYLGIVWDNNVSCKFNPYVPDISEAQKEEIAAEHAGAILFPAQVAAPYDLTYQFTSAFNTQYNCAEGQLYTNGENSFKTEDLQILVNGTAVDYTILSYYHFNTINTDTEKEKCIPVTVLFTAEYEGRPIVELLDIPITIFENKSTGIAVAVVPNKVSYELNETVSFEKGSLTGGSIVLHYQDGSTRDVTSEVVVSCDTSNYGKQEVTVRYGSYTTTYTITVICHHNYTEAITAPTCTSIGYTIYKCDICEDAYSTNITDMIPHTPTEQNAVDASCTKAGKEADIVCGSCGLLLEAGKEMAPTGHTFVDPENGPITDSGNHFCYICGVPESHLFRTTENETEVLCTCVICDHTAKFEANSREKISQLPRVVVSNAYSLPGENEVMVYLELFANVGITSAHFSIYFGDELELVSYEYGNILHKPTVDAFAEYSDHLNISLAQAETETPNPDYTKSNTLLKLVFKTPENAVIGNEYAVSVVNKAENRNGKTVFVDKFTSSKGTALDFIALNGKIKIVDRLPGDVTGDGVLDLLDAVTISKYSVLEGADRTDFLADMKASYEKFDISYGDVTLDLLANNSDVVQILRYMVGGFEARLLTKEFDIKLNYNDGTSKEVTIPARYNENGEIILNNLPVPQREGYRFDGWYYGFEVDAKKLEGNYQWVDDAYEQTLYAHYTVNSISFNGNGGTGSMESISYGQAESWTVTNEFTKISTMYFNCNGYVSGNTSTTVPHAFLGWALSAEDAASGNIAYRIGDTIDLINGAIGDLTLYAVWKTMTVTLPSIERTGYILDGWYTDADCYHLAGNVNSDYAVSTTATVYAKWTLIKFTIVFDGNGATSGKTYSNEVHSVETSYQLPVNGYEKTGSTPEKWNTAADGSGLTLPLNATVSYAEVQPYLKDNVLTLYMQWTENTYKIVFNRNEPSITGNSKVYTGSISGSMLNMTCNYGDSKELTENTFAVEGWIFKGWATSATGTVAYADMATVSKLTSTNDGTENLFAVWEVDPYSIGQYVANGTIASGTYTGANSYTVYNNIYETPQLSNRGSKVIIDWSSYRGTYDYANAVTSTGTRYGGGSTNLDIFYGTDEVFFIGNTNAIFTEVNICTVNYPSGSSLTIHLKDMNIRSSAECFNAQSGTTIGNADMQLNLDCDGTNSIIANTSEKTAIMNHNYLNISGQGSLTIGGGNSISSENVFTPEASNGSAIVAGFVEISFDGNLKIAGGIQADNDLKLTGTMDADILGANGKSGLMANDLILDVLGDLYVSGGNGTNGTTTGASGSDGAAAIFANTLTVNVDGSLEVVGGNGGNGVAGVTYSGIWVDRNGKSGGNGGAGGDGGDAIQATKLTMQNAGRLNLTLISGSGGSGGNGGVGESANYVGGYVRTGGNGGAGGDGGDGGTILTASEILCDGTLLSSAISVGGGGNGGDGGDGGAGDIWYHWFTGNKREWSNPGKGGSAGICGTQGNLGFAPEMLNIDASNIVYNDDGLNGSAGKTGSSDGKS